MSVSLDQIAADIAEIKAALAYLMNQPKIDQETATTEAELQMIKAQGLDIVTYYKNKSKQRKCNERQKTKRQAARQ